MKFFRSYTCRLACLGLFISLCSLAQADIKNIADVHERIKNGSADAATKAELAEFFEAKYKGVDLTKGEHKHLLQYLKEGGYAAWCLRAPNAKRVQLVAERNRVYNMMKLGESGLWIGAEKFGNFSAVHYRYDVDGKRIGGGKNGRFGFESYEWLPESLEHEGVPKGELIAMGTHTSTKHFKGAQRDWWVYVPKQYDSKQHAKTAKLMVFNDGGGFIKGDGNACTVLDNLIHQQKVPITIAVFINPGKYIAKNGGKSWSNRSNEYDTCTPRYATFLDEEILPIVREKYPHSPDPWDHAICGSSSGASCAFTAAWHRNDLFRRVISFVGSFCDFRNVKDYPVYGEEFTLDGDQFGQWKTAHDYPALIRKTDPRKEIKVYLQDGDNDLDNKLGNWFQNNVRMASALAYGGYDYKFTAGHGLHSKKHGMSILPEIMVWLWDDHQ